MEQPYIHGIEAQRADGILCEVVRLYENEWDVFLTRADAGGGSTVVACSVPEHYARQRGPLSKEQAKVIAINHVVESYN